jgi:arabinogalactan endo-1,4-beta-galactosidase
LKVKVLLKSRANSISEFLCVELAGSSGEKVAFGVVYNPPANNCIDPLKNAITEISERYEKVVFVGDFNIDLLSQTSRSARFILLVESSC